MVEAGWIAEATGIPEIVGKGWLVTEGHEANYNESFNISFAKGNTFKTECIEINWHVIFMIRPTLHGKQGNVLGLYSKISTYHFFE